MSRRCHPRKKGPAEILPFPGSPVRCWRVVPCVGLPGLFRAVLDGMDWDGFDGPAYTEAGPLELVISSLADWSHRHFRSGLPIVDGGAICR